MGNTVAKNQETINWNNIKTEQMSSTVPNLQKLSKDANTLIQKLNLPELDTVSDSDNEIFYKNKYNVDNKNESETSPFISSEMYNNFVKQKNLQEGGGDTSPTSECSCTIKTHSDDDNESEKKSEKKSEEHSEEHSEESEENSEESEKKSEESEEVQSGGEFSYLSSSAHTEGNLSEVISSVNNNSQKTTVESVHSQAQSQNSTVESPKNTTVEMSDSINTSDINMISVESA